MALIWEQLSQTALIADLVCLPHFYVNWIHFFSRQNSFNKWRKKSLNSMKHTARTWFEGVLLLNCWCWWYTAAVAATRAAASGGSSIFPSATGVPLSEACLRNSQIYRISIPSIELIHYVCTKRKLGTKEGAICYRGTERIECARKKELQWCFSAVFFNYHRYFIQVTNAFVSRHAGDGNCLSPNVFQWEQQLLRLLLEPPAASSLSSPREPHPKTAVLQRSAQGTQQQSAEKRSTLPGLSLRIPGRT